MYGIDDPEGLTFDDTGTLYLTNGIRAMVHRINPGANGLFDGLPPTGDDQASTWPTALLDLPQPAGIDYHNSLLYMVSNSMGSPIAEVTLDGKLQRTISLANITPLAPGDLTWAPASTGGDEEHIYLVARGIDNDKDPSENDGKLYEIAIPGPTSHVSTTSHLNGQALIGYGLIIAIATLALLVTCISAATTPEQSNANSGNGNSKRGRESQAGE